MDHIDEDETPTIAYRDLTTLLTFCVLFMLMIALPFLADAAKQTDGSSAGAVYFEIGWPDGSHVDVDMWVQAPGQMPVGYAAAKSKSCDLLRDDMGEEESPIPARYEDIYCRDKLDGEYLFNINLFSNHDHLGTVPVGWRVTYRNGAGSMSEIDHGTFVLTRKDEEQTLIRFHMKDGNLVYGSISRVFRTLKYAK